MISNITACQFLMVRMAQLHLRIRYADNETNYCAHWPTGGKSGPIRKSCHDLNQRVYLYEGKS